MHAGLGVLNFFIHILTLNLKPVASSTCIHAQLVVAPVMARPKHDLEQTSITPHPAPLPHQHRPGPGGSKTKV
jgi:hypothetical protein